MYRTEMNLILVELQSQSLLSCKFCFYRRQKTLVWEGKKVLYPTPFKHCKINLHGSAIWAHLGPVPGIWFMQQNAPYQTVHGFVLAVRETFFLVKAFFKQRAVARMNWIFRVQQLTSAAFVKNCEIDPWRRILRSGFSIQASKWKQQWSDAAESPSLKFDSHAYGTLLQRCVQNDDPVTAMALHCDILKKGDCLDLFATNILLHAYVKAELLTDAVKLFDEMPERNTISFVTLIRGYGQSLMNTDAADLFSRLHREGHELNPFVFTSFLKLLVSMELAEIGWCLHACIVKLGHDSNTFIGTSLIDMYSVCGYVDSAKKVFDGILSKDMVSWTGMVSCYAENDCFEDALDLFSCMNMAGFRPNNYTFAAGLKASVGLGAFDLGKCIHGCILKSCYELDIYVGAALLELYTRFGDIADALKVFIEMPKKDTIPWSFMIARFAQNDRSKEAIELFLKMRQAFVMPNQFTFASSLQGCATLRSLDLGRQIHGLVIKFGLDLNVFVSNALTDVYAKCERMDSAIKLFEESSNRNDVSWNTLIVGYTQLGDGEKALNLFVKMLKNQVQATEVTYSSALRACASMATLEPGTQIHALTIKTIYEKFVVVANALIDMYAKCGSIEDARSVFNEMDEKDVVSCNAMISGYSTHGLGTQALKVFEMMKESGLKPNEQTFVGVLSACGNAGLLDQGQVYFSSMLRDYGIEPGMEHYACMIWLLGRSGHLNKSMKLIEDIPFEPSVMVWRAMLGTCVFQKNIEFGTISAEKILMMEPKDEATHVLLSNMYAGARKWESVASIRKNMKKMGVKKEPGKSWIEHQGNVHYFSVGDTSHADMKLINCMLEWLNMKTRKAGYAPDRNVILLDMEDEEKDQRLWVHSERLALAYGLLQMPSRGAIRIIKNLRICTDCHNAMKVISKIVQRDLVIRDMNRFHRFHDGICSCGDYW